MLVWKDIRIRYAQTVMGFFWAILMPSLVILSGVLVKKAFSTLSGVPMALSDLVSISVKAIPWAFFVGAIRFSTNSLIGNSALVKKIYFPREVFPLASVLTSLFDFAIAATALALVLAVAGIGVSIHLLWLPILIGLLVVLAIAAGLLLSCANLFFRDVKYLVEVFLTFGIFFTPVFYEVRQFGDWAPILLLNPVAPILEAISHVVIAHQTPDIPWLCYAASWGLVGLAGAWKIFDLAQPAFAESV